MLEKMTADDEGGGYCGHGCCGVGEAEGGWMRLWAIVAIGGEEEMRRVRHGATVAAIDDSGCDWKQRRKKMVADDNGREVLRLAVAFERATGKKKGAAGSNEGYRRGGRLLGALSTLLGSDGGWATGDRGLETTIMVEGVAAGCNLRSHGREEKWGNGVRRGLPQGR
ncbi:hypothetical protein BHE74_00047032 [Ensete ventricosum]|nr:hypothetical protein GW17_00039601 [Ensete ventricosum]RWW47016.1 hypothetical protein BHE74_00047032 [Ensete ventricosum]